MAGNGSEVDWAALLKMARKRFAIERFRPGQREVMAEVFAGRDVLALMPTGAGKSLTYQLPALVLAKPVVVVSPLIALMQDQQDKAAEASIAVEKLDSTVTGAEKQEAQREIDEGEAQLVYVTPERLQMPEFVAELKAAGGIALLVVDEAHCIAQWGHDFRPAYLAIGEARRQLGMPPVLALTATATEEVQQEILRSLHAEDAAVISTGVERGNLFFAVRPTVSNEAKLARVLEMLGREEGTGILYTASVRTANELHEFLTEHCVSVGHYHGRMKMRERAEVQDAFMRGEHKVMIATKAFGLGIDKPDIRFVYHFEFPDSLETYYQEAGRAGRDGKPAHAVLLYRLEDRRIQTYFMAGRYPKAEELRKVLDSLGTGDAAGQSADAVAKAAGVGKRRTQVILNLLRDAGLVRGGRRGFALTAQNSGSEAQLAELEQTWVNHAASDQTRLADMMHYAETPNCRMQVIRAYFGGAAGEPCLRCDNCVRTQQVPEHPALQVLGYTKTAAAAVHETRKPEAAAVTTVATAYGEIHTTAPQTLPQTEAQTGFAAGDSVRHKRFGQGTVVDAYAGTVLVDFVKGGTKRLKAEFLEAA